jgi:thiol:disulfide interchange protein DsbC
MRKLLPLLCLACFSLAALADEAQIRKSIEAKLGGAKVDTVQSTPIPGIFEIHFQGREGPRIVYSDAQGTYFLTGHLIESANDRDLTEERLQKLTAIDFSSLPLDLAVKIRRGGGRRVLAIFSDPYCPYCRQLEKVLLQIDDITVYVFMYPVIRPSAIDQSRAVWCSPDRAKAWLDLAASDKPKVPTATASCANPVDKVLALGRSLRINGTPTMFFANGERSGGGMQLAALRAKLDLAAQQATKKD